MQVWEATTGTPIHALSGHKGGVRSVAWSPDGTRLACAGGDGTLRVWEANTGAELHALSGHASWVRSVAWSPDGTRLASTGNDGEVVLWNAFEGQEIGRVVVGQEAFSVDWSRTSGALAVGTDRAVIVYKP